jgi:hypothetical protein
MTNKEDSGKTKAKPKKRKKSRGMGSEFTRFTGDALEAKGLNIEGDKEIEKKYGERAFGLFNEDCKLVGVAFDAGNDTYDVKFLSHGSEDPAEKTVRGINWRLLRKQKAWLLEIRAKTRGKKDFRNGLVHLLDALQDCAVDGLGVPEEQVFGPGTGKDNKTP